MLESALRSSVSARPDQPVTRPGILSEPSSHPLSSRRVPGRVDLVHQAVDPVVDAGPWLLGGGLAVLGVRSAVRRLRG